MDPYTGTYSPIEHYFCNIFNRMDLRMDFLHNMYRNMIFVLVLVVGAFDLGVGPIMSLVFCA